MSARDGVWECVNSWEASGQLTRCGGGTTCVVLLLKFLFTCCFDDELLGTFRSCFCCLLVRFFAFCTGCFGTAEHEDWFVDIV